MTTSEENADPASTQAHEPVDVLVNGKLVARGEVVTVDGSYGVRVTEVLCGEG